MSKAWRNQMLMDAARQYAKQVARERLGADRGKALGCEQVAVQPLELRPAVTQPQAPRAGLGQRQADRKRNRFSGLQTSRHLRKYMNCEYVNKHGSRVRLLTQTEIAAFRAFIQKLAEA